jgi:hypothetical protein
MTGQGLRHQLWDLTSWVEVPTLLFPLQVTGEIYFIPLSLSFLICKMGIITSAAHVPVNRNK